MDLDKLTLHQALFDQFLQVVQEDVKTKTKILQLLKLHDKINTNQKTYVAVQIFMLKRYSNRLRSFQKISDNSIGNICEEYGKHRDDNKISEIVNKHVDILQKMKRRVKHIIDVSEKYAVIDFVTVNNNFSEDSFDLDPSAGMKDQRRKIQKENNRYSNSPSFS